MADQVGNALQDSVAAYKRATDAISQAADDHEAERQAREANDQLEASSSQRPEG